MAEQMKPSGIDWIGDIPNEWNITKVKYRTSQIGSGTTPDSGNPLYYEDGCFPWIQSGDLYNADYIRDTEKKITELAVADFNALTWYEKEFVVVAMYGASVGNIAISQISSYTNQACCVLKAKDDDLRYLFYFLSAGKENMLQMAFGGTQPNISQAIIKNLPYLNASHNEQQTIADFLDKECARIDSIAADLEKQIALLQQYKKSLITETVTKGLDKSVPMKDSGVEWIGEIPVGWELSRIKYLTDNHHPYPIGDGDHGMLKADDYLTEGIPYIRVLNLTWGSGLNLENLVFISKEMNSLIKNSELKPNDILIAKTGATIGKTAIVPDSLPVSNTTSHVGKITLANVHDAKYFYYVMTSSIVQKQIQDISAMQSTRPELGIEGLKNLILTVPPFDIQQHIARFLDDHCAKIDRVLHEKGKQLSVIKQHKKSLIYEYVTGKKRVKEVQ